MWHLPSIGGTTSPPHTLTKNLGKYLGVHLIHDRVTNETYKRLLRKLNRLTSRKNTTLSFACKITLIKTATTTLLVHTMQSVKPTKVRFAIT